MPNKYLNMVRICADAKINQTVLDVSYILRQMYMKKTISIL